MTIKLKKVSDIYLEPIQISMMKIFAKIVNGFCRKAPSQILYWALNTTLTILKSKGSRPFCLLQYIKLCGSVIKYSPFYQNFCHINAFLIAREAISGTKKVKVQNCTIVKETIWNKSLKDSQ